MRPLELIRKIWMTSKTSTDGSWTPISKNGQNMSKDGQNMSKDGQHMSKDGQNMSKDGQHMSKDGQNMSKAERQDDRRIPVKMIGHPLIRAAYEAFTLNVALDIDPDVFYMIILHSLGRHISKKNLKNVIVADGAHGNSLKTGWDGLYETIGSMLTRTGQELLETSFSTTGPLESQASLAAIVGIVARKIIFLREGLEQKIGTHSTSTVPVRHSGVPHVNISGSGADWRRLGQSMMVVLPQLGLDEWNAELQVIFDRISHVVDGHDPWDIEFWTRMCQFKTFSNGQVKVDGWITQLFLFTESPNVPGVPLNDPLYLHPRALKRTRYAKAHFAQDFPTGIREAPIVYNDQELCLQYGVTGVVETDTGSLRPTVGWIIAHHEE